MDSLWAMVLGAGLRDGINPCVFMSCALLMTLVLWIKQRSLRAGFLFIIFVFVYAMGDVLFNFGPLQAVFLKKSFVYFSKILYFFLGVWAFVSGILLFREWFLMTRGIAPKQAQSAAFKDSLAWKILILLFTLGLAAGLSALSTLWPMDKYIIVLGNAALIKEQWLRVMPLLAGYIAVSMWPLWLMWLILSLKQLRPSMVKIISASIFFTASSSVIFIFMS